MPRRAAGVLAILALVVAGCLDVPVASVAPTPTREPAPTPRVTSFRLETTVWYGGLVLTFDRAVATLDARGGSVVVDVRMENPGPEATTLKGPVALVVAGEPFEPTRESTIPEVPAGATAAVEIEFDVIGHASAADGAIVVGREGEHQPRVPFGPAGGEAARFEPLDLELGGTATAGQLRIRLRSAQLRWDLPDWAEQLPRDRAALTLVYDASYLGTFAGGFPFPADNVRLRLPDGTFVRPRRDGRSHTIELIGAGKTRRNLVTRFEIPATARGSFALFAVDGSRQVGVRFVVPD